MGDNHAVVALFECVVDGGGKHSPIAWQQIRRVHTKHDACIHVRDMAELRYLAKQVNRLTFERSKCRAFANRHRDRASGVKHKHTAH
jgi:hypothetical protein